jgi:hypothetical protein
MNNVAKIMKVMEEIVGAVEVFSIDNTECINIGIIYIKTIPPTKSNMKYASFAVEREDVFCRWSKLRIM